MADKKYALDFEMSDGTTYSVEFIVPQGEKGDKGDDGTGVNVKADATSCKEIGDAYIDSAGNLMILTALPNTFTNGGQIKGPKGDTGANGKDGVSATHSWNGTTLTISSASGTSSVNLKGEKGDKGDTGSTGANGKDGTSVYIDNITHSTESGGANVVEFSDGDTMTVLNGEQGIGIKSIETIGGDHNGSQHRITLDNGKTYDFYVEHGRTPDTSEIANAVLALLPVYDGEVESV